METRITELFGIQHPFIQSCIHDVGFAGRAAVGRNTGGLGIITGLTQKTPALLANDCGSTLLLVNGAGQSAMVLYAGILDDSSWYRPSHDIFVKAYRVGCPLPMAALLRSISAFECPGWVDSGQPSRREVSPRPVIDLPLQDRLDANAVGSTRTRRPCLITVVVSLTTALSDFAARLVLGHCVACPPGAGEAPKPRLTRAWHIACRGSVCGCGPMRAASRVPSSACGTRQR